MFFFLRFESFFFALVSIISSYSHLPSFLCFFFSEAALAMACLAQAPVTSLISKSATRRSSGLFAATSFSSCSSASSISNDAHAPPLRRRVCPSTRGDTAPRLRDPPLLGCCCDGDR